MPRSAPADPHLVLLCGDDDFALKQHARHLFNQWTTEAGVSDQEIIDGAAANSGEALQSLGRLREALQTLPFFGGRKAIWFQNCTFLGDDRTASAQAVTAALGELAAELKAFPWDNVRLLITAGKVDKRKSFYKTVEKIGAVETFAAWSIDDKNWSATAELAARRGLRERKKEISDEALAELVERVGPLAQVLANEVEKLSLYTAEQKEISVADVRAVVTRSKQARAFALGDAFGERNLPRLLRCLDEELWEIKFDNKRSEIGLLYGLITKVRTLIFLKEMLQAGWIKPGMDYSRFKAQLERVPADQFPEDRRFNPLASNPYVLYKALDQAANYSTDELVRAMNLLLECNQQLIFSNLDEALVLQQALSQIVGTGARSKTASRSGRSFASR